jgi:peptidoglycan/xylan/chitin deacetylase (PgdA/CDA1 family)
VGPALADQVHELEAKGAKVNAISLLYHDVVDPTAHENSGFPGAGPARYKLGWDDFRAQLDRIERAVGRPPTRHEQISSERSPWLLTFDDGGSSARPVAELLAERNWPAHFFVTSDFIGAPGFVNEDDIGRIHALGHVIGTHSCSHPERMSRCSWPTLLHEWTASSERLSALIGAPVTCASVPAGYYSRKVARAAAASGLTTLFTSEPVKTVKNVEGCAVVGRFTIRAGASPDLAARIASGKVRPRTTQFLAWNARKVAKTIGGEAYVAARRRLLERR